VSVDALTLLVLRTAAARDGVSVSELLRPTVERYARRRLSDEDLRAAVEAISASRQREAEKKAKRSGGASVRRIDEKQARSGGRPAVSPEARDDQL